MSTTKKAPTKKASTKKAQPLLKRDSNGLLEGVEYKFDDDGFIDWRAMVSPDMVYPNKDWFAAHNKPVPPETPEELAKLKDNQLVIKLGGLKKLLRLRGYDRVEFDINNVAEGHVVASAWISFAPNYETNGEKVHYNEVANARDDNTDSFGEKYLETFAANRAFARCIRNFLNINIVSKEEMDQSSGKSPSSSSSNNDAPASSGFTPQDSLKNKANEKGFNTFPKFLQRLRDLWEEGTYKNAEAKNWKGFKDVPAKDARTLITLI